MNCSIIMENSWREKGVFERENGLETQNDKNQAPLACFSLTTQMCLACLVLPMLINIIFHFHFVTAYTLYFSCYYESNLFFTKLELTWNRFLSSNTKKQHKYQVKKLKFKTIAWSFLLLSYLKLVPFAYVVMKTTGSFLLCINGVTFHFEGVVVETKLREQWGVVVETKAWEWWWRCSIFLIPMYMVT